MSEDHPGVAQLERGAPAPPTGKVRVTYDLHTAAGLDAMEANLNEVSPSLQEAERRWGLPYGLELGRRRHLIRCYREGICPTCDRVMSDADQTPRRCRCGSLVWKVRTADGASSRPPVNADDVPGTIPEPIPGAEA